MSSRSPRVGGAVLPDGEKARLRSIIAEHDRTLHHLHPRRRVQPVRELLAKGEHYLNQSMALSPDGRTPTSSLVDEWYTDHYGDQSRHFTEVYGYLPVVVRGAVFRLTVPRIIGRPPRSALYAPRLIRDLPAAMEKSLSEDEVDQLEQRLDWGLDRWSAVSSFVEDLRGGEEWQDYVVIASGDAWRGMEETFQERLQVAAFCFQQAVEKSLKAVLAEAGLSIPKGPKGHVLDELLTRCVGAERSMEALRPLLADVPWGMDVRYRRMDIASASIVAGAYSSLEFASCAVSVLRRKGRQGSGPGT